MDRNIILLFGGDSDERLVSVASAQSMAQAIPSAKLWYWHKNGSIFQVNRDELIGHKNPFIDELNPNSTPIFTTIEAALSSKLASEHVFLLGLHGGFSENGQLQEIFELKNLAFTGSSAKASRIAFNKVMTKECLLAYSVKMAPHEVIETRDLSKSKEQIQRFFELHGESVIKPVCGGSSIGCFFLHTKDELETIVSELSPFVPEPFLIEKFIEGKEISVGVIETKEGATALLGTEIRIEKDRSFDYNGKYLGEGSKEITPADLSESLRWEAQRLAVSAHVGLSLDGYSRTDMILAKDGYYFLEINTLPGLTKASMFPAQLAVAGVTLREFLLNQIELAVAKRV